MGGMECGSNDAAASGAMAGGERDRPPEFCARRGRCACPPEPAAPKAPAQEGAGDGQRARPVGVAVAAGADRFLVKPFTAAQCLLALRLMAVRSQTAHTDFGLNEREEQVLCRLAEGMTVQGNWGPAWDEHLLGREVHAANLLQAPGAQPRHRRQQMAADAMRGPAGGRTPGATPAQRQAASRPAHSAVRTRVERRASGASQPPPDPTSRALQSAWSVLDARE